MGRLGALAYVCAALALTAQARPLSPSRVHELSIDETPFPSIGARDGTLVLDACMLGTGRAPTAQILELVAATTRHDDLRVRPFACSAPRSSADGVVRLALWAVDHGLFSSALPRLAELDAAASSRDLQRVASRLGLDPAELPSVLTRYEARATAALGGRRTPGEMTLAGRRIGFGTAETLDNLLAQARLVRAKATERAPIPHDHHPALTFAAWRGADGAPLTLLFVGDLSSAPSARVAEKLRALPRPLRDAVRIAWLPLVAKEGSSRHRASLDAAELALAAREQGVFWRVHDRIAEHVARDEASDERALLALAAAVGFDVDRFSAARTTGRYLAQLEAIERSLGPFTGGAARGGVAPGLLLLGAQVRGVYSPALEHVLTEELARSALERFHLPPTR